MSAKADREQAERSAAARRDRIDGHRAAIRDAANLEDAITAALIMHDALAPHVPIGGGFLVAGRATDTAHFLVDALVDAGWTTNPRSTPCNPDQQPAASSGAP